MIEMMKIMGIAIMVIMIIILIELMIMFYHYCNDEDGNIDCDSSVQRIVISPANRI